MFSALFVAWISAAYEVGMSFLQTHLWLLNAIILNTTASNCIAHKHVICISTQTKEKTSQGHSSFFLQEFSRTKIFSCFVHWKHSFTTENTEIFHFLRRRPEVAGHTMSLQYFSHKTVWPGMNKTGRGKFHFPCLCSGFFVSSEEKLPNLSNLTNCWDFSLIFINEILSIWE